jgi:hypothetical protein
MLGSLTPWARIPWKYKSVRQKIYSTLFSCSIAYFVFYISVYGLSLYEKNKVEERSASHAIAILLDTSLSMSAADVKPNRYAQALSIAQGLISSFPASYITIPFGAIPLVRTPWSTDTKWVQQVLGQYSLWSYHVNDAYMGSAPGNAIWFAWNALRSYKTQKKTILLIGDGNTNTWYAIESFIPYLQRDGIQLYVCVIGESWYALGQNHGDVPVYTFLDTWSLDTITKATHGGWRMCNARQSSINRIHLALSQSLHKESITSWLPMDILHTIAVACIIFNILILLLTLWIYAKSPSNNKPYNS